MSNTVLSPPIPPYTNPPINPQYYAPSRFFISAISLGATTTVTTSVNQNYYVGQQVRLIIPQNCGTRELNNRSAFVLSIPAANQVVLDIFSIGMNAFVAASGSTPAQILAIGDNNSGQINTNGFNNQQTFIQGSFINISPI